MNISALFVRRPVMTTLVMAGILLAGWLGFRQLPVSDLPSVDFPTIQVTANLPGANPETMAAAVATPLEKQFSTIAALDSMTSTSAQGVSQITLQFALERDIDAAAQDVQSAIAAAERQLPPEMISPPSFRKSNPADTPVLFLALTSDTMPLSTVDEYAQNLLAQRISMVAGVAQVQVFGSQKYAVRIQLDPNALTARNIGIDEVAQAVSGGNANMPTGTLYGAQRAYNVKASGQLNDAAAYRPLIVSYRNGAPVRLDEIGQVFDGVQTDKVAAWYMGQRGIVMAIQRQPGTNTIQLVDAVKALLPALSGQIPPGIKLEVLNDRSQTIRDSVEDVEFSLMLALGLVVMVIFLFLRNLPATVIPSLALPMSLVGTFAVMYLCGYSINNLSLMALTLSVGFVVDDAIVMLENIERHIEAGESVMQATLKGAREIGFTIVSMTISLVAVFIPVLFMQGIIGRLLYEFAVSIMAAILVSGVVSLTLTPMLCSRILKPKKDAGDDSHQGGRLFRAVHGLYQRTLTQVLQFRRAALAGYFVIFALTIVLFRSVPSGFLPPDDISQLIAFTEGAQDISYEAMAEKQQQAAALIRQNPNVEVTMAFIGLGGSSQTLNLGRVMVRLKPRSERELSAEQVIEQLRPTLGAIPGFKIYLQNTGSIRLGGSLTKSSYQYSLQDADADELFEWTPRLLEQMRRIPGLLDVNSDLQLNYPSVLVDIDRNRASSLGVTPQQIESALYSAYGSRQVSTIYASSNQYAVIMELLPEFQRDPGALSLLRVRSANGALVPLNAVANISRSLGPLSISHVGQLPSATLSFNLAPGMALGDAVKLVEKAKTDLGVPATLTGSFQGTAQVFKSSQSGMGVLLLASILVIYLVLGVLYESFIHPITILSGLPTAALGAVLTLLLFRLDLSLYAMVGMIMLIGIAKKNAIMMIDFALEAERTQGLSPEQAIYQACLVRFRPIMMTTMAALLGTLPIALGLGAGSEARRPLGLVVVGGLLVSQVLTLYITPVIYVYLDRAAKATGWGFRRAAVSEGA